MLPVSVLAKSLQLLRLVFHTNRVITGQSVGLSDDQRKLGVAFANFQIVPVDAKNNISGN